MISRARTVGAVLAVLVLGMAAFVLMPSRANEIEWFSFMPPKELPRFGFLGQNLGSKANTLWERVTRWKPRKVSLMGLAMEFDSPASLTNLPPALSHATNSAGDRLWIFGKSENCWERFRAWPGAGAVSTPSVTCDERSHGVIASGGYPLYLGAQKRREDISWRLDLRADRVSGNSVRLSFFAQSRDLDRKGLVTDSVVLSNAWSQPRVSNPAGIVFTVSNRTYLATWKELGRGGRGPVMEIGVLTNAWAGARVMVPAGDAMFLLSSRTNSEGKYFGALLSPTLQ